MTELLLMADISSNNGTPNLGKHYDAGYRLLALKATEGTDYTWDGGADLAHRWHELGGRCVHYHFTRPGGGQAQADHYLRALNRRYVPGDFLCIDAEVAGVNGSGVTAFINRCHAAKPDAPGLVYGPPYFLRDAGIKPVHGWGLWVAQYASRVAFIPPGWDTWDAWQFTDHATIPGMSGGTDHSKIRRHLLAGVPLPLTDRQRKRLRVARHVLNGHKRPIAKRDRDLVDSVRDAATEALHR